MQFKIDTKEKFQEIYLLDAIIPANMTGDLIEMLTNVLKMEPRNAILCMDGVAELAEEAAEALTGMQSFFYEQAASFVICGLQPAVEESLDKANILETMNVAPTLSEAWDLVQMEEIERELLGDDW